MSLLIKRVYTERDCLRAGKMLFIFLFLFELELRPEQDRISETFIFCANGPAGSEAFI